MNNLISITLITAWIVTVLISKYYVPKNREIDILYIKKRKIFRVFSVLVFSSILYLVLNPQVSGTVVSFKSYSLWIVWYVCAIGGIKFLYDITGPILSSGFVSKLNSDNYAVYLRSFSVEKKQLANSIENDLCAFLKKSVPVLAIGDPHEVISSIGAERLYASDNDWEKMIVDLINHAKIILVRPSNSVGCLIELNYICRLNKLSKCLFIVSSKEDIIVLQNHLKLRNVTDLQLLESNMTSNKVLGLKLDANGKYSSFVFGSTFENLTNFLILFGIDISKKAKPLHLSLSQHITDRIAFALNPLFYSSLFEWGFFNISMISLIMLCPVILLYCNAKGISPILQLMLFISFITLFMYFFLKATCISQSKNQFASATHYMTRVRYLLYFNSIFMIAFILILLWNPIFRHSFFNVIRAGISFLLLLTVSIYQLLTWPLLIVIMLLVLFYIWKKH